MTEWAEPDCLEWLIDLCIAMKIKEDRQAARDVCQEGG